MAVSDYTPPLSFDTEPIRCPNCNHKLDRLAPVGHEAQPVSGDFTLCFYCSTIMVFVEPVPAVRRATERDVDSLDENTARFLERICHELEQAAWLRARLN